MRDLGDTDVGVGQHRLGGLNIGAGTIICDSSDRQAQNRAVADVVGASDIPQRQVTR